MQITLKLILDELGYECEGTTDAKNNPTFECVELLASHGSDFSGKTLLVCTLSEALAVTNQEPGLHFLCIRDRVVDELETQEAMCGLIVVKRNLPLREFFNEIQRVFVRISNWLIDMQHSVMGNEGMQALVTLSESIIGNHIAVMDPTFKLIAHTKNVETDDAVSNSLIQHGYHPLETVESFKLHRRLEQFEKADGIIVSEDFVTSNYITVKKVFRCRNSYSVIVVMVCCNRHMSDGLLDLFKMMLSNLQVYVDRDYPPKGDSGPVNALVCDLLDRNIESTDEIKKRAQYAGLAFLSEYDLFLICFDDNLNIPLGRLVRDLSDLLPFSYVLSYQRGVIVINQYGGERRPDQEMRLRLVDSVISTFSASCGISTSFSALWEIPAAYEQASVSIWTGTQLHGRAIVYTEIPEHGQHFYFEDYVLYRQIAICLSQSPQVFKNSFFYRALQTLSDYENRHNVKILQILHTYLQCERRATEACARLHMHRNTVLYHIKRIEEVLGVSLDDPEIRLKLLLGFKLRDLDQSDNNDGNPQPD